MEILPDQTPHSVASDLGLHYLPMSHKKDARLIWVNRKMTILRSFSYNSFVKFHGKKTFGKHNKTA